MRLFANRVEAAERLASVLSDTISKGAVVLAIPRGGVVVGFEVARILGLSLDVIVPRKIGAPGNPELAIGAMTEDGTTILDQGLVSYLQVSEEYIEEESRRQRMEIERRLKLYRGTMQPLDLKNRDIIIVDDGIATGSTMKAALASVRKSGAKTITVAIPVGPVSTIRELEKMADRVVCLYTPEPFYAIGEFYEDFAQTENEEVAELLRRSRKANHKVGRGR